MKFDKPDNFVILSFKLSRGNVQIVALVGIQITGLRKGWQVAMSELTCPRCHAELDDENDPFCDICGQPIRCPDCNTLFRPEARFCKKCGKPISGLASGTQPFPAISIAPGYNHLKVDETPTEFHAEMLVTNEAIREIRDWIPQRTGIRMPMRHTDASNNHQDGRGTVVEVVSEHANPGVPQLPAASEQPAVPMSDLLPEDAIWKIFHKLDGGKLRQVNMKLKASTKKSYTIRLICLYLFAKELLNEEKVPREEVYAVLQHATVKDGNQAAYISQDDGILTVDKDCLQLSDAARIRTYQYIAEVSNSELKDGWYPGMEAGANKHPKGPGKRKKSGDKNANVDQLVAHEETKALAATIAAQHTAVVKWQVLDKALLGLYGIFKVDKEQEVIASLIAAYLHDAFSIPAKEDSIRPALYKAAQNSDPNIIASRDGQGYRITQSGCNYIEEKLNGGAKP